MRIYIDERRGQKCKKEREEYEERGERSGSEEGEEEEEREEKGSSNSGEDGEGREMEMTAAVVVSSPLQGHGFAEGGGARREKRRRPLCKIRHGCRIEMTKMPLGDGYGSPAAFRTQKL